MKFYRKGSQAPCLVKLANQHLPCREMAIKRAHTKTSGVGDIVKTWRCSLFRKGRFANFHQTLAVTL